MPTYNQIVSRPASGQSPVVPEPMAAEIIKDAPKTSVSLTRMRQARMSTKTQRQPVLSTLPDAYWVNGDTGRKQTTVTDWTNLVMTAEELATLVVVPNAYVDDSSIRIWDEVRPLIAEAIGRKLDLATIWGIDKPASFPTALVPSAIAAGNVVASGDGTDTGVDVAALAGKVAADGFSVNGFATEPGFVWSLIGQRTGQGAPIYNPDLQGGQGGNLFGFPLTAVENGSWQSQTARLVAADWSKFIVGVRQDITYEIFDQMVISDDDGKVIFNAPQQDSKVMRVVFRVGYQQAVPLTRVGTGTKFPAGVLTPGA